MSHPSPIFLAKADPWQAEQTAREADPANRVAVPERLTRPSPLLAPIIAAVDAKRRMALSRDVAHRVDGKPLDYSFDFDGLLFKRLPMGLRVTIGSADRAILILDTVIKACESRGLRAFIGDDGLRIGFGDYSARVRISERVEQLHGVGKKTSTMGRSTPFIAHRPTSKLTMFVERLSALRSVADKPGLPLEAQVNAAIILVYRAIAETRAWREHIANSLREAAELQQAQAAIRAKVEAVRQEAERSRSELLSEAAAWQKAALIRAYVDQIVAAAPDAPQGLHSWTTWARSVADEIDPTAERIEVDKN